MRIVRACEATAADARYQGGTVADLADASRVSERSVRNAFANAYLMSPTAYLRVVALNEVRRALSVVPPCADAVTRVASDHGFWHLGRFASYYRTLFGETRATLAQNVPGELRSHRRARKDSTRRRCTDLRGAQIWSDPASTIRPSCITRCGGSRAGNREVVRDEEICDPVLALESSKRDDPP